MWCFHNRRIDRWLTGFFLWLFKTFHKCWLISIVWIVFIQLSSSSGKMPGIGNLPGMHSASKYLSSVIFNINTAGHSSGLSLVLCKYLHTLSLIPTTLRVFSVELEALSSTFILTSLQKCCEKGLARQTQHDGVLELGWCLWLPSLLWNKLLLLIWKKNLSFLNFA